MNTDSFIFHIRTEDVYKYIAHDVGKRFDTSIYAIKRLLFTWKKEKSDLLMKDGLEEKIMAELVALRPNNYYWMDDDINDEKAKGRKKYVIKRMLKFNDYKNCLLNEEIILKSQQRFKNEAHYVLTDEINKTVLSSNDDN